MNFQGLKAIIKNIKGHVRCPHCENSFADHDINVISSVGERCVIVAKCMDCHTPILVTATIKNPKEDNLKQQIITEQQKLENFDPDDFVNSDDVVALHKFLKDFEGDFSKIFQTKNK